MKSILRATIILSLLMVAGAGAQQQSAYDAVKEATNQLLSKLKEIQPLYETDKEKFFDEVEKSLTPFIDFDGFARGVMAKYYRRASDEQKKRFAQAFKSSLIRTYADALVGFDNQRVEILEPDSRDAGDDKQTVKVKIYGRDGQVYPVDYSMVYKNGKWKLRNIVVNGINIGLQYRSQFSAYMQKYDNMDQVIENWDVKVE